MSSIKDFFINLKYNTEGKVALASIVINIILILILFNIMTTGDVPGYTPRAELEANATECTLEHIDPNATTTTTVAEDEDGEDTDSSATNKDNNNTTKKTTTKNNGGNNNTSSTTKKTSSTTKKTTSSTTKSLDNDGEWLPDWY